jgi:pyruvate-formate lyase
MFNNLHETSFHEEVTPSELTKIMKNIDDTIVRLEKYTGDAVKKKPASRGSRTTFEDAEMLDQGDEAIVGMWNDLKSKRLVVQCGFLTLL